MLFCEDQIKQKKSALRIVQYYYYYTHYMWYTLVPLSASQGKPSNTREAQQTVYIFLNTRILWQ